MRTQNAHGLNSISIKLGLVVAMAGIFTGCGAGSKVVSGVAFKQEVIGTDLYAGIDATLAPGSIVLPSVKLPLYNPKNPSQNLGSIETNGLHIIATVNASEALKLSDLADGTKLPNGAAIPLVLPANLKPIAIPAFNSNSLVYVAINGNQILVGVAVSILKEDSLKLPISLFLPFTISPEINGTAGFFLGDKQGVAVFALKDGQALPSVSIAPVKLASVGASAKIAVKSEAITSSTLKKFQRAKDSMRNVRID